MNRFFSILIVLAIACVAMATPPQPGPVCPPPVICPPVPCPDGIIIQSQGIGVMAENTAMRICAPVDPISTTTVGIAGGVDSVSGASAASLGTNGLVAQSAQVWQGVANVGTSLITNQANQVTPQTVLTEQGLSLGTEAGVIGNGQANGAVVISENAIATNGQSLNAANMAVGSNVSTSAQGGAANAGLTVLASQFAAAD